MSQNTKGLDMSEELRESLAGFVDCHPHGWDHTAWQELTNHLRDRNLLGTLDEEAVGRLLERTRVVSTLAGITVKGLGPKRREAIADAFGRLWELRAASPEELSALTALPRETAHGVIASLEAER
jgi:hypothetical protein